MRISNFILYKYIKKKYELFINDVNVKESRFNYNKKKQFLIFILLYNIFNFSILL